MSSLRLTGFLFAAGVVAFVIALFAGRLPFTPNPDGMSTLKPSVQPILRHQKTNPQLIVPESMGIDKPLRYSHNWDDNPVAYIPEAELNGKPRRYPHNWDDNSVAHIPEATVIDTSIFVKEVPTVEKLRQYPHNWDDNPVATIPESTIGK